MAEKELNQGQHQPNEGMSAQNVAGQAQEVIGAAMAEVKKDDALQPPTNDGGQLKGDNTPSIGEKFKGLPMRELISNPLIAAAEAQQQLAATA